MAAKEQTTTQTPVVQQPGETPQRYIVRAFLARGYVRVPRLEDAVGPPYPTKKGYEVRVVVRSDEELADVVRCMGEIGFKSGKPFKKHASWAVPIYGQIEVDRFLLMVAET